MTTSNSISGEAAVPSEIGEMPHELAATLRKVGVELNALNGSSEEEFLAIGARLHDFQLCAGEISAMATEIVNLVEGDEINKGIESLKQIIERLSFYLKNAAQKAELSDTTLYSILEMLNNVDEPLSGFRKMNKVLRMLGISTRIESTRLADGADGFDTLANDVQQLYFQINEKASSVHDRKKVLNSSISQILERVRSMEAKQRANAGTILDKTGLSLAALSDINSRCSGVAASITSASLEVAGNIATVVTSMQFHDITRQQIEHAGEALTEVCARLDGVGESGRANALEEIAGEVGDVCELQVAQLGHALNELLGAIDNIMENLRGIGAQEATISAEIREMTGVADKAGASFFKEMESDLTRVASVLERSAIENRNLAVELDTLAGTIEEISLFVNCIETIGEEIELIALNAQIKAARTGEEGTALGVLAEAIQRLSLDARSQSREISAMLGGIVDVSGELSRGIGSETSAMEGEVQELVKGLGELLRMLQNVNAGLLARLERLDRAVESLNSNIAKVTAGITVQQKTASVLGKVTEELAEIASRMRMIDTKHGVEAASTGIKGLSGRYTMHIERKIHEAVTSAKHNCKNKEMVASPSSAGPAGEFGDNVELF
jgi:methyl-accepting chemotaxis protein